MLREHSQSASAINSQFIMIGFLFENRNRHLQDHLCRRRDHRFFQAKLLGSLSIIAVLLLGTATTTTGLPTPSSVRSENNLRRGDGGDVNVNANLHYFNDDDEDGKLLADLWLQLCSLKKMASERDFFHVSSASLPVGVSTGSESANAEYSGSAPLSEKHLLLREFERVLRDTMTTNDDSTSGNLASLICEEESMQLQQQQQPKELAVAQSQTRKLFLNDENDDGDDGEGSEYYGDGNGEILAKDNSQVQRQVIFIQIPETRVNLHVHHQRRPETTVYVLPPMEETHVYKIVDMRGEGSRSSSSGEVKQATPPAIHFLTNFGSNKITANSLKGISNLSHSHTNLHGGLQAQSKSKTYYPPQNGNYRQTLPVKGVSLAAPIIPAPITDRFIQRHQKQSDITTNSNLNGPRKDFEILPAFNGYFFH